MSEQSLIDVADPTLEEIARVLVNPLTIPGPRGRIKINISVSALRRLRKVHKNFLKDRRK